MATSGCARHTGKRLPRQPRAASAPSTFIVWQPNSGHGSLGSLGSLGGKFSVTNSNGKRNVARERRQGTSIVRNGPELGGEMTLS
eukprot:261653-Prymnesium_polylepis.1